MSSGRSYSAKTLKILFAMSSGRCSFPGCRIPLVIEGVASGSTSVLAEIAHIKGLADEGPRADASLVPAQRNHHSNLMILCPTHHAQVDQQVDEYPVELLKAYKVQHERWVDQQLSSSMPKITSAELDLVCKHIAKHDGIPSTGLHAVPHEEKMAHNGLGDLTRKRLTIGLAQSRLVAEYLQKMAANVDADFPGELRAGFVAEYDALWANGLRGDALFVALSNFAGGEDGENSTFARKAAGLAVLAHLFQVCDVFEEVPR